MGLQRRDVQRRERTLQVLVGICLPGHGDRQAFELVEGLHPFDALVGAQRIQRVLHVAGYRDHDAVNGERTHGPLGVDLEIEIAGDPVGKAGQDRIFGIVVSAAVAATGPAAAPPVGAGIGQDDDPLIGIRAGFGFRGRGACNEGRGREDRQ